MGRRRHRDRQDLPVSRKVGRKVLRSGATEFRDRREEQSLPRSGPCQDELDRLLEANEAKPLRERLTLIRVFETLREGGYAGGQDAVRIAQPERSFLDPDKGPILRAERHRHLPDLQGAAVQNVLKQAEALLAEWAA